MGKKEDWVLGMKTLEKVLVVTEKKESSGTKETGGKRGEKKRNMVE